MRKLFKFGSVFLCIAMLFSILAACSGGNSGGSNAETPSGSSEQTKDQQSVKLRLSYWGAEFATAQKVEQTYKEILDEYKEMTGTEVEFVFVPDKNYRTWMVTQQAADSMPEVVLTRMDWVWEDYAKGQVIDLGPYMEEESPYNPGMPWKDTFLPSYYHDSINPANGIMNSAPAFTVMVRILYNKDLFEQAGIEQVPQTWQEFMEVNKKLKEAGITPMAMSGQSNSHITWFLTSLVGQLDEPLRKQMDINGDNMVGKNELARATDLGLIDFSQYPFRDAFELFKEFSQYWNSDFNGIDELTAQQLWLTGQTAMLIFNSADLSMVEDMEGRNFEYGGFPIPYITKDQFPEAMGMSVMLGGAANESWAISSSATEEQKAAAIDLIQYLTSPKVMGLLGERLSYIPTINNADLPERLQGFVLQNEDIRRANYFGPATIQEFSDFVVKAMQMYLGGSEDLDQMTQELNAEWNKGMQNAIQTNGWSEANNYGMSE